MVKKSRTPSQVNNILIICLGIALIISIICLGVLLLSKNNSQTKVVYNNVFDSNDPYTEQKFRAYLVQLHVKYPSVAIAQMKLETDNGKSNLFIISLLSLT